MAEESNFTILADQNNRAFPIGNASRKYYCRAIWVSFDYASRRSTGSGEVGGAFKAVHGAISRSPSNNEAKQVIQAHHDFAPPTSFLWCRSRASKLYAHRTVGHLMARCWPLELGWRATTGDWPPRIKPRSAHAIRYASASFSRLFLHAGTNCSPLTGGRADG